jgi:hypothetical protein
MSNEWILTEDHLPAVRDGLDKFIDDPEANRAHLFAALMEPAYAEGDLPSSERMEPHNLRRAKLRSDIASLLIKVWKIARTMEVTGGRHEAITAATAALKLIDDTQKATVTIQDAVAHEPPVCLGSGKFSVGDRQISLEDIEAIVVEALVDLRSANQEELRQHSGVNDAPRVLARVAKKYPDLGRHIILPGKRGAGGYSTTIERAAPISHQ